MREYSKLMSKKKVRIFVFLEMILALVMLTGCGKYSDEYTTLVINDNIDSLNQAEKANIGIRVKIEGEGISNTLNASFKTRWLFIDGKAVCKMPNSDYQVFSLLNGTHSIQIRDDSKLLGKKSNEVTFLLEDDNPVVIDCYVTVEKNKSLSLIVETEYANDYINEYDYYGETAYDNNSNQPDPSTSYTEAQSRDNHDAEYGYNDYGAEYGNAEYDEEDGNDEYWNEYYRNDPGSDYYDEDWDDEDWDDEDWDDEYVEWIIPDSDRRYIAVEELYELTAYECKLARNEIYARRGRMFSTDSIQQYFNSCSWYTPIYSPSEFDEGILNDYELANTKLIKSYEDSLE